MFLIALVGLTILSGFCLAMTKHSCCQPKSSDCPIQSVQNGASPAAVRALENPGLEPGPVSKPAKDKPIASAAYKQNEIPEFILPNYHLSASITHQTNAPPQA